MAVTVRSYKYKDKDNVRKICLETSEMDKSTKGKCDFITTLYCDYYIEREPHNCFVAVNENDEAIGYILCSTDYYSFKNDIKTDYISKLKLSPYSRLLALGDVFISGLFKKNFPAHLHIDILDAYQRQGIGHLLMDALIFHLKHNNIKGVMLCAGSGNTKGISFYKKYGFIKKMNAFGATAMVLKL